MKNSILEVKEFIIKTSLSIAELDHDESALESISITSLPEKFKGDFDLATNAPMILVGKQSKYNLTDLSEKIASEIVKSEYITNAKFTPPGFINIKLSTEFLTKLALSVFKDSSYGFNPSFGNGEKVNIEYVSANPTGPMHIGHARGAIYGDIISEVLSRNGFIVTREYYSNDAGGQIDTLVKSAMFRYLQFVKNDFSKQLEDGLYPGDYLINVAKNIFEKHGDKFTDFNLFNKTFRAEIVSSMLKIIFDDLNKLKVRHDIVISEKEIQESGYVDKSFGKLKESGLIYNGVLQKPKGQIIEDWEEREQEIFASSKFGDDVDRPLKKSDGSYTYFAGDVGYHYNKISRGFGKMILILGSDHKGYKKRIASAVSALSDNKAAIDVKLCEIVNFVRDGKQVKMSKRKGDFVTVSDVLEEVNLDVLRFVMLTKKSDTIINFDLDKVKDQSKENPVFYVQYAHSRCCSLLRKASEIFGDTFMEDVLNYNGNVHWLEKKVAREVFMYALQYPNIILNVTKYHDPHLIIFYAIELCSKFHSIWNAGTEDGLKFVDEGNKEITLANMALVMTVKNIISSALGVCKITPMEKM